MAFPGLIFVYVESCLAETIVGIASTTVWVGPKGLAREAGFGLAITKQQHRSGWLAVVPNCQQARSGVNSRTVKTSFLHICRDSGLNFVDSPQETGKLRPSDPVPCGIRFGSGVF